MSIENGIAKKQDELLILLRFHTAQGSKIESTSKARDKGKRKLNSRDTER